MTAKTDMEIMRKRADWMAPADDQILELLEDKGNLTPEVMNNMGGPTPNYVVNRCRVLSQYGLVDKMGQGLYRITDTGREYLTGEIDATELEPVDE